MSEERDYGTLGGAGHAGTLPSYEMKSQVYQATHRDNLRTDYMYRSFISFTFGGKHIEDFNLLATFESEGMDQTGYADFEDLVSENEVVDGQVYWGTHIKTRELSFKLATDGMTQRQLDDFLSWFAPGKTRELILAEHPNRAANARISSSPELQLIPFEKQVEVKLGGQSYTTSTTLYKGSIILTLIMDEPYWHSLINIFGYVDEQDNKIYHDAWTDANNTEVNVYDSKDALKIVVEDGIPLSNMIQDTMMLGNNVIADMNTETGAITMPDGDIDTLSQENDETGEIVPLEEYTEGTEDYNNYWRYRIAKVDTYGIYVCGARISGPYITSSAVELISINKDTPKYFYYAGTAKSYPTISFSITPHLNVNYYIDNIKSTYTKVLPDDPTYNTITIKSLNTREFKFTTPGLFSAYNKAIYIFNNLEANISDWEPIRTKIREEVKHHAVRAWANKVIDYAAGAGHDQTDIVKHMAYFLCELVGANDSLQCLPVTFTFNSKNGEAIGKFNYRTLGTNDPNSIENWSNSGVKEQSTENVGDMIKSPYLYISDRNYPNSNGNIVQWTDNEKQNSHVLIHDVDGGIHNVSIEYRNMYW